MGPGEVKLMLYIVSSSAINDIWRPKNLILLLEVLNVAFLACHLIKWS